MLVTKDALDRFQTCPLLWAHAPEYRAPSVSSYSEAKRELVRFMYSKLLATGNKLSLKSLQDQWDQLWWFHQTKEKHSADTQVFDLSADGWIMLSKYMVNEFRPMEVLPVAVNLTSDYTYNGIQFEVHFDVVLVKEGSKIVTINLASNGKDWDLYNSLSTRVHILALHDMTGLPVEEYQSLDVETTARDYNIKRIRLYDPQTASSYLQDSKAMLSFATYGMTNKGLFGRLSEDCKHCPYGNHGNGCFYNAREM